MPRIVALAVVLASGGWGGQPPRYRYGAGPERLLASEPHGATQYLARDFEVHDGLGVVYVRAGHSRVARLVSGGLAAKIYTDLAPLGAPDGWITAGDCWLARQTAAAVERMLLSSARRLLYETVAGTTWFGRDHLDSVTMETDGGGGVVGRRRFAPFGATLSSAGDVDRYGFTGQETDETGMLRFQFRQLDVAAGRWASVDPLFARSNAKNIAAQGESTTAHAYVANSPTRLVDPTGLSPNGPKEIKPAKDLDLAKFWKTLPTVNGNKAPNNWNCVLCARAVDRILKRFFRGKENFASNRDRSPISSGDQFLSTRLNDKAVESIFGKRPIDLKWDPNTLYKTLEDSGLNKHGARGILLIGGKEGHAVNIFNFGGELFGADGQGGGLVDWDRVAKAPNLKLIITSE